MRWRGERRAGSRAVGRRNPRGGPLGGPDGPGPFPALVFCVGLSLEKEVWLLDFARYLPKTGFVALPPVAAHAGRRHPPHCLEAQPEVDAQRLGVFGAIIAAGTAAVDRRVRAGIVVACPGDLARVWSATPDFAGFRDKFLRTRRRYATTGEVSYVAVPELLSSGPDTVARVDVEVAPTLAPRGHLRVARRSIRVLREARPRAVARPPVAPPRRRPAHRQRRPGEHAFSCRRATALRGATWRWTACATSSRGKAAASGSWPSTRRRGSPSSSGSCRHPARVEVDGHVLRELDAADDAKVGGVRQVRDEPAIVLAAAATLALSPRHEAGFGAVPALRIAVLLRGAALEVVLAQSVEHELGARRRGRVVAVTELLALVSVVHARKLGGEIVELLRARRTGHEIEAPAMEVRDQLDEVEAGDVVTPLASGWDQRRDTRRARPRCRPLTHRWCGGRTPVRARTSPRPPTCRAAG